MMKILAVVTLHKDTVSGGGAPRFVVQHIEELQQTAFTLEKILDANAHDLKNGTIILVRH